MNNNVVNINFADRQVQKQTDALTPDQQLKLHTIQMVFDQEKVTDMLTMAYESVTIGEGIDLLFSFVANIIYGKGGKSNE